ncbi:MAG: VTT domain-containing protein [Bacteroidota bacterium]
MTDPRLRSVVMFLILVIALIVFLQSGLKDQVQWEKLRELGENPLTPIIIVVAMTAAWTFALPGSVFFFVTPLLFGAFEATAIVCLGSTLGTLAGYGAARYVGRPWVEKFRNHGITKFLERHSSFASLFAIRVVPSSQHWLINYGAGLLRLPIAKFLLATVTAVAIKAFLYAKAIQGSVGASNIRDALNWETVAALMVLGGLAVAGHIWQRRNLRVRMKEE